MSSCQVLPVVMAGGSGTRLWPLSRAGHPKQFIALHGDMSLFQAALARIARVGAPDIDAQAVLVVGSDEHRFIIQDQLAERGVSAGALLLEPQGRNTAPALTLAALHALD